MTRDDGLIRTPDGDLVPDIDDAARDRDRETLHRHAIKAHADEVRRILRESRARQDEVQS